MEAPGPAQRSRGLSALAHALSETLIVVADLTFAVEVGMVLAALMFIRKISRTTIVARVTKDYVEDSRKHILQGKHIPPYATVYRIHGPFLFGAIRDLADTLHASGRSLLLCGAREQPAKLMHQADFERHVGAENIRPSIADAIHRAATLYQTDHAATRDVSEPVAETPAR